MGTRGIDHFPAHPSYAFEGQLICQSSRAEQTCLHTSQCLHSRLGDVLQCPASDHSRLDIDVFLCPLDHFVSHILFDRQDNSHIPLADKGNASAFSACSCSTSNPMHVICRISRDIVIDDKIDGWDVETS